MAKLWIVIEFTSVPLADLHRGTHHSGWPNVVEGGLVSVWADIHGHKTGYRFTMEELMDRDYVLDKLETNDQEWSRDEMLFVVPLQLIYNLG